jgi:anti-sigma-K factor RskA
MAKDLHVVDDLPGYVLGCLEEDEIERLEKHLAICDACRRELSGYQEVAGQLAASVEMIDPPEYLKARLMQKVTGEEKARRPIWWEKWIGGIRKPSLAWAAIGLGLILILGIGNLVLLRQVQDLRAGLSAPLRTVAMSGTDAMPSARGVIVISLDGRFGTLIVDDLAQLAEDQEYQLWLIRDGERDSGGLISVNPDGYGWVYIHSPEPLANYSDFGVTIEPAGGSPAPTGDKVLGGEL